MEPEIAPIAAVEAAASRKVAMRDALFTARRAVGLDVEHEYPAERHASRIEVWDEVRLAELIATAAPQSRRGG